MYSKIEPKPNISNMMLCCCKEYIDIKLCSNSTLSLKKSHVTLFKFCGTFLYHQASKG